MDYINELKEKNNGQSIDFLGKSITPNGVKGGHVDMATASAQLSSTLQCFVKAMNKLEED